MTIIALYHPTQGDSFIPPHGFGRPGNRFTLTIDDRVPKMESRFVPGTLAAAHITIVVPTENSTYRDLLVPIVDDDGRFYISALQNPAWAN